MVASSSLTEQDLTIVREQLAAGGPCTVWFTSAAVGVTAGGSAKVMSLGAVPEGDFIEIRPTGSRDTMFCAPGELTRTRPPRKRHPPPAEPAPERIEPPPTIEPPTIEPPQPAAGPAAAETVLTGPGPARPGRRRPARARPAPGSAEVTVVVRATSDGSWTVEASIGGKQVTGPTSVPAADIGKAARFLPAAVAEAVEASLDATRHRRLERVEQLRTELDAAERALQELSS